ncbi:MAG: DUF2892 domain-containing protein [Bacteroidia bacterium]|nr:DUF2892 domain-containing protein [Bacteroidia bacterium]
MKKNMGNMDRMIRLILAAVLLIVVFATNLTDGVLSYVLLGVSATFILTSLISFCPLYPLLGINTCPREEKKA